MPHRCVHCRITLPEDASRCPTCESNVAEEVPEADFTIEVRITNNRDGSQLRYVDDVQVAENMADGGWAALSAERVQTSVEDGTFQILEVQAEEVLGKIVGLLSTGPEPKPEPDEVPETDQDTHEYQEPPYEVEFLKVGEARDWSAEVKRKIREHRAQLRTVDESEFTEKREIKIAVRTVTKAGWLQQKVDEAKRLRDNPDDFDFAPYDN